MIDVGFVFMNDQPNTQESTGPRRENEDQPRATPRGARVPGQNSPAYYYGRSPSGTYGYGPGAGYGEAPYYGSGEGGLQSADSILGPMSIGRVIRVVMQKWPSLIVSVLLGLGIGFAYFKTAPVVFSASSVIEMQATRPRVLKTDDVILHDPNTTGTMNEIINTRLAKLRSREVILMVAERVRADFANLKSMADEDLIQMLIWSVDFKPRRMSRLIDITARHSSKEIAQGIANAYAITTEVYSMDENKAASDAGVAWLKATGEAQRRVIEKADDEVLRFRVDNKIDVMENQKRAVDSILLLLNNDLARAEIDQSRGADLLAVLNEIQKGPDKISSLPEIVPRGVEIATAQADLQNAITERDVLLMRFTDKHPDVVQLNNKVDVCRRQFLESVSRARETASANLELMVKQTESLRERTKVNEKMSSELELKLISAKARLEQLQRDREAADMSYRSILRRIEDARLAIDDSSASTRVIEKASLPQRQIAPDPRVAFSTGPLLGLLVGFLFIMVLDRLEDRVTGVSDIERHMSTKVLAMIPRVPHVKRDQLVKLCAEKKFSRFAESFAGLRGLLESPRYIDLTHVILVVSTQPEEGKTVTSCNLAMTYAMSGKKTLLIDFDLRRPRIGRMFHSVTDNDRAHSLVDVLDAGDIQAFDNLPIPSGFENLSLVTSRTSTQISPSTVMGCAAIRSFFEWAREHYEHILVDSPPYGLVSDAVALGSLSDSVILVCRPERSRYRAIRHALRSLLESGARVLGVIVNDIDFKGGGNFGSYDYSRSYGYNHYGRYGRYGYGYGYYPRGTSSDKGQSAPDADGAAADAAASSELDVADEEG